jgi:GT2 family glycosyltransferase
VTQTRQALEPGLRTLLEVVNASVFTGFVVDPVQPDQRFTVELLIDGLVTQTAYAAIYVDDVENRIGDGCHGFAFSVPQSIIENAVMVEVRVANLGILVGNPLFLPDLRKLPETVASTSRLRWLGGLRFSGWVNGESHRVATLKVMVDGALIQQVSTLGWAQADDNINKDRPVRAFDFHLPERFADGRVRWLSVLKDTDEPLSGGPAPFVAFPDGLAATIASFGSLDSERLRGEMYDHLIPMSLPMSQYDQWRQRFPVPTGTVSSLRCAVVLVGQNPAESSLESLENQTHADWVACVIDDEGGPTAFDAETAQAFLTKDAAGSDFVVFALTATMFEPNALQRLAQAFSDFEGAAAAYGDIDMVAADGGIWPLALPAFDYERMLEQGYCAHLFALRSDIAEELLNSSPSNLYRLFNSLFDEGQTDATSIIHVPGSIGILPSFDRQAASLELREANTKHLQRRGINVNTTVLPAGVFPAVRIRRDLPNGRTTIVIPTRNRLELLRNCLQSIRPAVEKADADIVIIDNDSADPAILDFLADLDGSTKVMRVEGPFNFAQLNNIAAEEIQSEYLCLLNNDIEAVDEGWLDEMLTRIAEPDVGAVGALLLWPSGVVQHGGVVLGPNFAATHAFNDRTASDPGYADLLRIAHECGAVTAACMLTRRSDYLAVGGMDEVRLTVSFNDVDYCLRLREAGKRIVFTPHAKLIHLESASRGNDDQRDRAARYGRELGTLRARWGQSLIDDPYYNPMLSLDHVPFSALAWPPRNMTARTHRPVVSLKLPPGF